MVQLGGKRQKLVETSWTAYRYGRYLDGPDEYDVGNKRNLLFLHSHGNL